MTTSIKGSVVAEGTWTDGPGEGAILRRVFDLLDRSGVRYCVLHGSEDLPDRITSDVDCILDKSVSASALVELLHRNGQSIGADLVQARGRYLVLAQTHSDRPPTVLALDFQADCAVADFVLTAGEEILAGRRKVGPFWVPAADLAFDCTLARSIAKGRLDDDRGRKLAELFGENPESCERRIHARWTGKDAELIRTAVVSGSWDGVRREMPRLAARLRRNAFRRRPIRSAVHRVGSLLGKIDRVLRPDGVYVALLGPDGAGKSSIIDALEKQLLGVFNRSFCYGFAPAFVHHLRHGAYRPNDAPHALRPRSYLMSVARAVLYWLPYYTAGYLVRHADLARNTLVLNDRHYVDVLVDPKRYRYGGPMWLVRAIWRVIPKPDLIVLLDAPPEILQSRKQEVSFEETARQRRAYLSLVQTMPMGRVVDSGQPFQIVAAEAGAVVLRHLRARVLRRHGLSRGSAAVPASIPVLDPASFPAGNQN